MSKRLAVVVFFVAISTVFGIFFKIGVAMAQNLAVDSGPLNPESVDTKEVIGMPFFLEGRVFPGMIPSGRVVVAPFVRSASSGGSSGDTSGSDTSGSGQGSGGGAGNGSSAVAGASTDSSSSSSCGIYFTDFIMLGGLQENDPSEVRKLQEFLNDRFGKKISADGVYSAKTVAAVNEFQLSRGPEVLAPWGITKPTGNVYLTTRRALNIEYCAARGVALALAMPRLVVWSQNMERFIPPLDVIVSSSRTVEVSLVPASFSSPVPPPATPPTVFEPDSAFSAPTIPDADSTLKKSFWQRFLDWLLWRPQN